jgi:hypothetical protein
LEDIKATPHTETFARALEVGAVLLWVRAEAETRQAQATAILSDAGAADVHLHERFGLVGHHDAGNGWLRNLPKIERGSRDKGIRRDLPFSTR